MVVGGVREARRMGMAMVARDVKVAVAVSRRLLKGGGGGAVVFARAPWWARGLSVGMRSALG